jgi:glycosyltransferase involved in cell wall biosynthesis
LQTATNQIIKPGEIIIADDGSGDETKKVVEDFRRSSSIPVKHIWHADDGFRKSMIINKAVAACNGNYILHIDGDVLLHSDFIKDHLNAAREKHFIGGSRVILDEFLTHKVLHEMKLPTSVFFNKHVHNKLNSLRIPFVSSVLANFISPKKIENIRGCNMSFWKKDFIAVNGYNEEYTGWGREDSDLVVRFFILGLKRIYFKFKGIEYHLHHKDFDRSSLERNDDLLKKVMQQKNFRCGKGIDQYL